MEHTSVPTTVVLIFSLVYVPGCNDFQKTRANPSINPILEAFNNTKIISDKGQVVYLA